MAINVFLADDHAIVRDGLKALLQKEKDIEVVGESGDGIETVSMVTKLSPDIVLMDIDMPGIDGIRATERILKTLGDLCRIIILSMYATTEHIFMAFKAGVRGYVPKESVGEEVLKAIRAVYSGKRYVNQKIGDMMIDDYVLRLDPSHADDKSVTRLSPRERQIVQFVAEGKSSTEIGSQLFLSPKTIDTYRSRLMHKLGISDLPSLVRFALQHGIISNK